ncbi:MAG: hypothetical protein ACOX0Z_00505 [Candidatus Nanosyncoccaceae bacterium]|jgi:hypothetical protein
MKNYYFKKQRLGLVITGGLMSLLVAFSLTPTFAGMVAAIKNTDNSASTGTVILVETGPDSGGSSTTCSSTSGSGNSYDCITINKFGNNGVDTLLSPGGSNSTTINLKNTGNLSAAKIAVVAGECLEDGSTAPASPGSICDMVDITITAGGQQIFPTAALPGAKTVRDFYTAAASGLDFSTATGVLTALNGTGGVDVVITTTLKSTAGAPFQGKEISQAITWQIES